jgi:hypothetical protein
VDSRLIGWGGTREGDAFATALRELVPDCSLTMVDDLGELARRTESERPEAVVLLDAPIAAHDERVSAILRLRKVGYTGRIIAAAGFLTARREAVDAGADYAFDPVRQRVEQVTAAALYKPRVAADHPYLKALLVGEAVLVEDLAEDLPDSPPDVALVATSQHQSPDFYASLTDWYSLHSTCTVVIVEDGGGDDVVTEALASGADHYVVLEQTGVGVLQALVRRLLRERWLAKVTSV